ncbi:hypothetical protein PC128_g9692 [Phytophthora cactorum]|nr:hypothetical protein PC128_g9692 [Phytophthora cactorum]
MKQTRQPVSIGREQEVIHWIETVGEGTPMRAVAPFRAAGWSIDGGAPLSETLEELLYEEFVTKRTKKEKVTRSWLASMVLTLYASETAELPSPPPFAASDYWVSNFMRRFEISLRRRTNLTVLDDDVLVNRAVCYMSFLREQVPTIDLEKTVLMDESVVYFEDARASTLDFTGARHVVVRSTDFASMRITVALAVSATGRKLPPLLVWKGKAAPTFEKRSGPLYVARQPRAWVDSELLKKWIDLAFPFVVHGEGKCLVWDSMRAHISKAVKDGDIGIYKSFKDLLYLEINAWKQSDKVEYTRSGNPRMPCVYTRGGGRFSQNPSEWFIAKHDVYGAKFREKWSKNSKESSDEEDLFNFRF